MIKLADSFRDVGSYCAKCRAGERTAGGCSHFVAGMQFCREVKHDLDFEPGKMITFLQLGRCWVRSRCTSIARFHFCCENFRARPFRNLNETRHFLWEKAIKSHRLFSTCNFLDDTEEKREKRSAFRRYVKLQRRIYRREHFDISEVIVKVSFLSRHSEILS